MTFDFDTRIERRGTDCLKWDLMGKRCGVDPADGIAMWVADMDFASPPAVAEALAGAARHNVYGYYGGDATLRRAIAGWLERRHGWRIEPEWIVTGHGLVATIAMCLQAYTEPGDEVIVFTPVYHAFHRIIAANGREVVQSPLVNDGGRYRMDLAATEAMLTGRERVVLISSPHNPGGTIWTAEELRALAGFCTRHDLLLISDEIHHDLVYPGHEHVGTALAAPEIGDRLVTLAAASKTFNLAGGATGYAVVADPGLRARLVAAQMAAGSTPNMFGAIMTIAAYDHGEDWLEALIAYLDGNRRLFDSRINAIPGLASMPMQATYLAWVDFAGTGMTTDEFTRRVTEGARIGVNAGTTFGKGGESFLRFNIGLSRPLLEQALERVEAAFADLQ